MLYIVKYSGPFGFIKPWTAVRDEEVYSQQFLTPSIIGGIERKLFPELLNEDWGIFKIKGHRLTYSQISQQQEQTQPRGWNVKGQGSNKEFSRPYSILKRGVLVNPTLYLAFDSKEDAEIASKQHLCLSRNEDMLYPDSDILEFSTQQFNEDEEMFSGFELVFEENDDSFLVGYNRMHKNQPMYGWLRTLGNPVKTFY
ncbi:MAG: hypothetical protein KJ578_07160 [Bacteroidetes bacterium]|nr:hypothetical protein [Bacteroidota bacterium]MBU1578565.1 hypothetical protein [Bacteroidota bacterium]MBU2464983.1 hypothetical protein [Bacteroidota bacterium]MBU2557540.1 hypothetical protein [Bacteroidota bacterium]